MKAITCSQCGALIKQIRLRDKFAECDYCHAKIPVEKEKVIVISEKKPQLEKLSEKQKKSVFRSYDLDEDYVPEISEESKIVGFMIFIAFVIAVPIVLYYIFSPDDVKPKTVKESYKTETPTPASEPCPNISVFITNSYWEDDKHFIQNPELSNSALPTCDLTELRKGIFSDRNRIVEVKVTVNKEGDVTAAKLVSGDEFFKESAERAALKSLFIKQKRQTTKTITYRYFILD
jgi:hypothetical protein